MAGGVKPGAAESRIAGGRRRALIVLVCWGAVSLALAVLGGGVGGALSPSVVIAPGTPAAGAQKLAEERFGPTQLVPVLLQGPARSIESQGPGLVAALVGRPHTRVLSPWNAPAGTEGLRPSPTAAMVLVSVQAGEAKAIAEQPALERTVAAHVAGPVRASVTGQPSIDQALRAQALSVALRDGLIALGVLLVLCLLSLRAPVATALVGVLATAAALSGLGAMRLLGSRIAIDPVAVPLGVMTGLALGGAYGLIVLDRFHRDLRGPGRAASMPLDGPGGLSAGGGSGVLSAGGGRGVLLAGGGLVAALLVASAIAPSKVIVSVGIGVLLCGGAAALAAGVALPAALLLLGSRAAWTLPAPGFLAAAGARLEFVPRFVSKNALTIAPIATAALVLLALPTLTLKSGQPGIGQLPPGNKARVSFERVAQAMGPGWPTPYTVVLASSTGPLTTAPMLLDIEVFQQQIAKASAVASVSGPGSLSTQTKPLGKLPGALNESGALLTGGKRELGKLLAGLGLAGAGAQQLREGLGSAASGAAQLHSGSGSAQSGAQQLHDGLATARSGSAMLQAGLGEALTGARALQNGATQALAGSVELFDGVSSVAEPVHSSLPSTEQLKSLTAQTSGAIGAVKGQADSAGSALARSTQALEAMTSGRSDPRYEEALEAVHAASDAVGGVSSGLADAQGNAGHAAEGAATLASQQAFLDNALGQLRGGAQQLQVGLGKLRAGNVKLAAGIGKLAAGGGQLTDGLMRLRDGAGELQAGLGLLTNGAGELQSGLTAGIGPVGELVGGLGLLEAGVAKFSGKLPSPKDLEELRHSSPGLFGSGYFVLAAIEGAPADARNAAAFVLNVQHGGNAAEIAVISRYGSNDARTAALGAQLRGEASRFGASDHLATGLGGPAANLGDLTSAAASRRWWAIAGASLAVLLVLGAGLWAFGAALMASALALMLAAASFGLLTLLFGGSSPLLGGPGYLDPISQVGIFAAAIGVSLAFLAPPLLELRRRRNAAAPLGGGTGYALAGLIGVAVLIPFAACELSSVRQFAVGVALVIALAALLGRLLILPVAVRLLGQRGWWPHFAQLRSEKPQSATRRPRRSPMRRGHPQT